MTIGITGGIGSGKSTLSALIRKHGYPVYDTDKEARRLQDENQQIVLQIKNIFGEDIYQHGKLDRSKVASLVFNSPELLKKLTLVVHPAVKQDFMSWRANNSCEDLVFVESAVLFEGGFNQLTDKVILVTASEEIRIQRVTNRDGISREQVLSRIKNQIPDTEKASKSDLIINTDQGLPEDVMQSIVVWQH